MIWRKRKKRKKPYYGLKTITSSFSDKNSFSASSQGQHHCDENQLLSATLSNLKELVGSFFALKSLRIKIMPLTD
jgi:hypothetical protein